MFFVSKQKLVFGETKYHQKPQRQQKNNQPQRDIDGIQGSTQNTTPTTQFFKITFADNFNQLPPHGGARMA